MALKRRSTAVGTASWRAAQGFDAAAADAGRFFVVAFDFGDFGSIFQFAVSMTETNY